MLGSSPMQWILLTAGGGESDPTESVRICDVITTESSLKWCKTKMKKNGTFWEVVTQLEL